MMKVNVICDLEKLEYNTLRFILNNCLVRYTDKFKFIKNVNSREVDKMIEQYANERNYELMTVPYLVSENQLENNIRRICKIADLNIIITGFDSENEGLKSVLRDIDSFGNKYRIVKYS